MSRVASRLHRHQAQREQMIPTITVLVGCEDEARAAWSEWLGSQHREMIEVSLGDLESALGEWAKCPGGDRGAVLGDLSARLSVDLAALFAHTDGSSARDRQVLVESARLSPREAELVRAWLEDRPPELSLGDLAASPWLRPLPGLLVHATPRALIPVAEAAPQLPIAVRVAPGLALDADDRASALLRAGVIDLGSPSHVEPGSPSALGHGSPSPVEPSSSAPLEQGSLSPLGQGRSTTREDARALGPDPVGAARLMRLRSEARIALSALRDAPSSHNLGRAKSAAEALLFAALESTTETRGLFELNARLPFRFGPGLAEGDLVAFARRLVVEVDGYFHLRDLEAYRRDRRKDRLCQIHGFIVLRFLAEDVVEDLSQVVSCIKETVVRPTVP